MISAFGNFQCVSSHSNITFVSGLVYFRAHSEETPVSTIIGRVRFVRGGGGFCEGNLMP